MNLRPLNTSEGKILSEGHDGPARYFVIEQRPGFRRVKINVKLLCVGDREPWSFKTYEGMFPLLVKKIFKSRIQSKYLTVYS